MSIEVEVNLLDGRADGAQDDGKVELAGLAPLVGNLLADGPDVVLVQLRDFLIVLGVTSDEGTLAQVREDVLELMLLGKFLDITQDLSLGEISERVFDPVSR